MSKKPTESSDTATEPAGLKDEELDKAQGAGLAEIDFVETAGGGDAAFPKLSRSTSLRYWQKWERICHWAGPMDCAIKPVRVDSITREKIPYQKAERWTEAKKPVELKGAEIETVMGARAGNLNHDLRDAPHQFAAARAR